MRAERHRASRRERRVRARRARPTGQPVQQSDSACLLMCAGRRVCAVRTALCLGVLLGILNTYVSCQTCACNSDHLAAPGERSQEYLHTQLFCHLAGLPLCCTRSIQSTIVQYRIGHPPLLSGTALVVVRALPGVRTPPDPRAECQEQLSRRREAASVGSAEPRLTTHDAYTDIRHLCIICPGCGYHMPRVRTWPARDAAQSCVTRLRCQPCTMIRWYNNL